MATRDWESLGDRVYRKRDLYKMLWERMDLSKFIVAGAPYGGPVALVLDPRKLVKKSYSDDHTALRIFTSAGKLISQTRWEHNGLVKMGWTDQEHLICVLEDGMVYEYSVHGELLNSFSMGTECKEKTVAEVCMWGNGLVCRTAVSSDLWTVSDLSAADPRPRKLANSGIVGLPTSMAVISPDCTQSGVVEVLLGTPEGSVVVVDEKSAQDQLLSTGPGAFTKMVVSPSGSHVACFNQHGTLFVMTTDFQRNLCKFDKLSKQSPLDIAWCGEDSVLLAWEKILLMVGPTGDFVKYPYSGTLHMVSEMDGLRLISDDKCEFLHRVPESTEAVFKIGATTPAALLFDAAEAFQNRHARADENIRNIKTEEELEEAIEKCLDAAMHETDGEWQRKLLQAAAYGALFCESWDADATVNKCRTLRVLNAVRHYTVGIPLTFPQYEKLDAEVLIDRLIQRHEHLLAMRICEYLRIPPERVLVHWACAKIKTARLEDEALGKLIVEKLEQYPGISYSKIANTAFNAGRNTLATMLLDYEPRAADQVPLLISMKEDTLALNKAIQSLDTDLIYLALLQLKRTRSDADLFDAVKDKPLARALLQSYCRATDLELLKKFYYHLRVPNEAANVAVIEAYRSTDWKERMQGLEIAEQFYAKDKTNLFPSQATQEQIKLLQVQRKYELELGDVFVDMPLSEMIELFIRTNQMKRALDLKAEFKVPDKRFWYIHIRTLARSRQWEELEKLVGKKAPPVGFQPFVEACVDAGSSAQAAKYIARLEDPVEKMEWFCSIEYWKEAIAVAAQEKDMDALQVIRARCRNPQIQSLVDKVLRTGKL